MDSLVDNTTTTAEPWHLAVSHWLEHCEAPADNTPPYLPSSSPPLRSRNEPQQSSASTTTTPLLTYCESRNSRKRKRTRTMDRDTSSLRSVSTATTSFAPLDENTTLPPRPKSRARSTSPSRTVLTNLRLAKPSISVLQPDRNVLMPEAVLKLHTRLRDRLMSPHIPCSLREKLMDVDPDQVAFHNHLFEQDPHPTMYPACIELQWLQIDKIYNKARMGHDRPLDEAYWVKVVTEILEMVTEEPQSKLQTFNVQTQGISKPYLPIYNNELVDKRIDLSLGFDSQNAHIGEIIMQTNVKHPTESLSQMVDAATSMVPLGCGIEVTPSGGDHNESVSQLSVWCAAGHKRMQKLCRLAKPQVDDAASSDGPARTEKIRTDKPPLVGWTIVGHDWRFHISWIRENGSVMVVGPWTIFTMSTRNHLDIWRLLVMIREIRSWLEEVYWPWLKDNVLDHLV